MGIGRFRRDARADIGHGTLGAGALYRRYTPGHGMSHRQPAVGHRYGGLALIVVHGEGQRQVHEHWLSLALGFISARSSGIWAAMQLSALDQDRGEQSVVRSSPEIVLRADHLGLGFYYFFASLVTTDERHPLRGFQDRKFHDRLLLDAGALIVWLCFSPRYWRCRSRSSRTCSITDRKGGEWTASPRAVAQLSGTCDDRTVSAMVRAHLEWFHLGRPTRASRAPVP